MVLELGQETVPPEVAPRPLQLDCSLLSHGEYSLEQLVALVASDKSLDLLCGPVLLSHEQPLLQDHLELVFADEPQVSPEL